VTETYRFGSSIGCWPITNTVT